MGAAWTMHSRAHVGISEMDGVEAAAGADVAELCAETETASAARPAKSREKYMMALGVEAEGMMDGMDGVKTR